MPENQTFHISENNVFPGHVLQLAEGEYVVVERLSEDGHHIIAYPVYVAYSDKGEVRVEGVHTGTRGQTLDIGTEVTYIGTFSELALPFLSSLSKVS